MSGQPPSPIHFTFRKTLEVIGFYIVQSYTHGQPTIICCLDDRGGHIPSEALPPNKFLWSSMQCANNDLSDVISPLPCFNSSSGVPTFLEYRPRSPRRLSTQGPCLCPAPSLFCVSTMLMNLACSVMVNFILCHLDWARGCQDIERIIVFWCV